MRTDHRCFVVSLGMVLAVGGGSFARAQSPADPSGHWEGSVQIPGNSIPFVVDLAKDAKGQRTGTMEEVKWSVPEGQLFPFDEGCR